MPKYLANGGIWEGLWPVFAMALVLALVGAGIFGKKGVRQSLGVFLFGIGLIGGATGYLTGISREPVVGAVIPALLTLIGGFAVFEASRNKEQQTVLALVVATLAATVLIATQWGSDDRVRAEVGMRAFEEQDLERYLQNISRIEDQVNQFRGDLGLPPIEFVDVIQKRDKDNDTAKNKKKK